MTASIFLGFLALLFAVNAVINTPLDKPIYIGENETKEAMVNHRRWYVLSAERYSVDADLSSIHIRSSFLPFVSHQYTYFRVTVNPESESAFSMAVRVTGAKQEELFQGKTTDLYGMISDYREQPSGSQAEVLSLGLNDNGTTIFKRGISAAVFALAAGVCIWLIVKIVAKG